MGDPEPLQADEVRQQTLSPALLLCVGPRTAFIVLCGCITLLLGGYVMTVAVRLLTPHQWQFGLAGLFDLNAEANVPTYFSVIQLAIVAVLLVVIGWHARTRADRFARHWLVLGAIFLFLSLDELAQIHEQWNLLRDALHTTGMLYYAWVLPYGLLTAAVGVFYIGFLLHLPARTRWLFVLSGLIYVGGAVGLEMYGGYLESHIGREAIATSLPYLTEVFFEEGMEMFGIALFIYALLAHMQAEIGRVAINIGPARGSAGASPPKDLSTAETLRILQDGTK